MIPKSGGGGLLPPPHIPSTNLGRSPTVTHILKNLPIAGFMAVSLAAAATGAQAQTPVNQSANNSGAITGSADFISTGAVSGPGASVTISTTGAAAATSVSGINVDFGDPALGLGNVTQSSTNSGTVITPGREPLSIATGHLNGMGVSVSVSATGALSALSIGGIGATPNSTAFSTVSTGDVVQSTSNSGAVSTGQIVNNPNNVTPAGHTTGSTIRADGVTVSVTSTGAASSVSGSFLGASDGGVDIGNISQSTGGYGAIYNWGEIENSGFNTGGGSTFSIAATGAVSSVSSSAIASTGVANEFGTINQSTTATSSTFNQGRYNLSTGSDLRGNGMTASISATGAASAVSATAINAVGSEASFGNINQSSVATGTASVLNRAYLGTHNGSLQGHGSSQSASATGAIASASATAIGATNSDVSFANIVQGSNNAGSVRNEAMGNYRIAGHISGDGASLSASATGAGSVVGATVIRSNGFALHIDDVQSTAVNSGVVENVNSSTSTGANPQGNVVNPSQSTGTVSTTGSTTTMALHGAGSSVSVSASGATAALSLTSIGNTGSTSIETGAVSQSAINSGAVTNYGGSIAINNPSTGQTTGQIAGAGASASISASGAVASFSILSINDSAPVASSIGSITQSASNSAAVSNSAGPTGTVAINVASGITGAGASASISAVGAGAYASFAAIRSVP